jgi:hypothetical protein
MAKVASVSATVVRNLAGVIDFYYWKGIPICRKWPKRSRFAPTPAVIASRQAFTQSRADLRLVSGSVRTAWAKTAVGATQAWLDYYTSIYMRIWRDYRRYPALLTDVEVTEGEE